MGCNVQLFNKFEQLNNNLDGDIVSSMRPLLIHPAREDLSLPDILYALGDPLRLRIAAGLSTINEAEEKVACQDFLECGTIAKSTLSFHFKILREAGLVRMVPEGRRVLVSLRRDDLEARFPGLLTTILSAYQEPALHRPQSPVSSIEDALGLP